MKPKYGIGVLLGAILIYVAIMGLTMPNFAALLGTPENYTAYTPVGSSHLAITANAVTQTTSRDPAQASYLYADKGAGHFGDFTHTLDFQVSSSVTGAMGMVWMLSNSVGDGISIRGDNLEIAWIGVGSSTGAPATSINFYVRYFSSLSAWFGFGWANALSLNTRYYLKVVRAGSSVTASVYTDSARTVLLTGGTVTDPNGNTVGSGTGILTFSLPTVNTYRYIYACNTNPDYSSSSLTGTVQIANLNLGGSSPPPPTSGTLRVFASYNGAYVGVSVTVSSSPTQTGTTTTDSSNPLTFSLPAGTYTVTGTYNGNTQSPSQTVTTGATSDVTLNFGGSPPPPPPNPFDINAILTPAVRAVLLLIGVATAGISSIYFFASKTAAAPKPPGTP